MGWGEPHGPLPEDEIADRLQREAVERAGLQAMTDPYAAGRQASAQEPPTVWPADLWPEPQHRHSHYDRLERLRLAASRQNLERLRSCRARDGGPDCGICHNCGHPAQGASCPSCYASDYDE